MESQNKPSLYSVKFLNWVEKFASTHSLFDREKSLLVAVSGGVDSVVLGEVLARLHQRNAICHELALLHIDHQTRSGEDHKRDLDCVLGLADKYELDVHFETVKTKTNQEHILREARESLYRRYAARYNAQITTGHHLNDSFEWSLMQKMKSSNLKKSLGIPVRRDHLIRPFLCVTKSQIEKFADLENLNFENDETNTDISYERNYVRHEVIPKIEERYPKYLKHYVNQNNELAGLFGLSSLAKSKKVKMRDSISLEIKSSSRNIESLKPQIRDVIHELSQSKRGSVAGQLDSLVQAYRNYKKGPVSFSGGVHAHLKKNQIVFSRSKTDQ